MLVKTPANPLGLPKTQAAAFAFSTGDLARP